MWGPHSGREAPPGHGYGGRQPYPRPRPAAHPSARSETPLLRRVLLDGLAKVMRVHADRQRQRMVDIDLLGQRLYLLIVPPLREDHADEQRPGALVIGCAARIGHENRAAAVASEGRHVGAERLV